METVALKAFIDALESFGPGAVLLAGLVYLIWRGEISNIKSRQVTELKLIHALELLTTSNNKLSDSFDKNIKTVESINEDITSIGELLSHIHRDIHDELVAAEARRTANK